MNIKTIRQIEGTERQVRFNGGISLRLLLASDGMGFSLNKTIVEIGGPYRWHYKNHLEACFCVRGRGEIRDLSTGFIYTILPDMIYILNKHDAHEFTAHEETVLISVFNPPLIGSETHQQDGSYPLFNV